MRRYKNYYWPAVRQRRVSHVHDAGGCVVRGGCAPLRSGKLFENEGSNEAIWCNIFYIFIYYFQNYYEFDLPYLD